MLYLESPTNPTIKVVDIPCLAAADKKAGAIVVVDNTFATPINQNPLVLGVVENIVGPPATTIHVECTREKRASMGIPESLVRYSSNIEETENLIGDLGQALSIFE